MTRGPSCVYISQMDAPTKGYLFENDEHRTLREQIRRFATNAIAPHAHELG